MLAGVFYGRKIDEMINRIAILNFESFTSNAAIQRLIETWQHRVILFCASEPFGGKWGSPFEQFKKHLGNSGFCFTLYLGFNGLLFTLFRSLRNIFCYRLPKLYSARKLCQKYRIRYVRTKNINGQEMVELLRKAAPDLVISFHFDQIVQDDIIDIPRYGIINVHAALLPDCRGPLPVFCSLLKKQKLGFTIHSITNSSIDTGPIILKKQIDWNHNESALLIERDLQVQAAQALEGTLSAIERGIEGDSAQQNGGFYFSFPDRRRVREWRKTGLKLFRITDFFK